MDRFLVLTPAIDGADGISELSRQVVRALAAEGAVEVWALAGGAGALPPGVTFRTAGGSRARLVSRAFFGAIGIADSINPLTVVVMHAHLAPLALALAARTARLAIFLVGIEVWRPLRTRERLAFERADCLIAISRHTERRFREANPDVCRHASVALCPPAIQLPPLADAPGAVTGLDVTGLDAPGADVIADVTGPVVNGVVTGMDLTRGGFALIVGRMWSEERYKGHDLLIDVWPSVRSRAPDARLVMVGDGDDRPRLEARVREAGLGQAIRCAGRVGQAELNALYRAAAFFVMPSVNEGFGLAYLEAMRAGRPCIALHGAADEIIEDRVSGLLVDANAPDRLVDAIVQLFTDVRSRDQMGRAAAARVAAAFTDRHFADRLRAALGPGRPLPAGLAS